MTEELDKKIREIANYYVSECWGTYLDLSDIDLVSAGIGLALAVTKELQEENAVLERIIERAKECMKKLLFIINSDPANYNCKGLVQDAEDFIHNRTCNIRQQGQHCISETRCIMCDKEIKEK